MNGENLVWQTTPLPGRYQVFASLYASCGKPAVRFRAVLYQALTGRTPHHDLETLGQLIIADGESKGLVVFDLSTFGLNQYY